MVCFLSEGSFIPDSDRSAGEMDIVKSKSTGLNRVLFDGGAGGAGTHRNMSPQGLGHKTWLRRNGHGFLLFSLQPKKSQSFQEMGRGCRKSKLLFQHKTITRFPTLEE